MLRVNHIYRRALVAPAPVCSSAATGAQMVNRIIGRMNSAATNAAAFGDILGKVPKTGMAATYAHLGRAFVFLNRGEDKLANYDIDNARGAAGAAEESALLIASAKYRIAARLLAEEQRKASISGATSEMQIASVLEDAKKALEALMKLAKNDLAVFVAAAEFHLYSLGEPETALRFFEQALELARQSTTRSIPSAGKAAPWDVAAAAIDASTDDVYTNFKCKLISADKLVADPESLASLRTLFGLKDELNDEQVTLLGSVLAIGNRGGAVLDCFRMHTETFLPASFPAAQSVMNRVACLTHPYLDVHHVAVRKPKTAQLRDGVTVADLVKSCPKDTHILDHIEATAGTVPETCLHKDDEPFFQALNRITLDTMQHVPASPSAAAQFYMALAEDLMGQVALRAQVGRADALLHLKKYAEAEAVIDEVVNSAKYVDHWRALLVKGQVSQALGKIDEADAAFVALHALRRHADGCGDIPLMDEYRHKSSF